MANAKKDQNRVSTIICALNTDGITPVNIKVDPTSHYLYVSDGTTGSDNGTINAQRDQNRVTCLVGVSSADFSTPVEIYADSSNNLLTKST